MALNELLSGDDAASALPWDAPSIESAQRAGGWRTVGQLQALEEEAMQVAREEGYRAGLAAAKPDIDARLAKLDAEVRSLAAAAQLLARPLAQLDAQVQEQLTRLSIAIARQLLRRELKTDPSQVIAVVRETVALLPAATRDVRVALHPDDAAILRERLAMPQEDGAWTLVEDPVLSRGGCRVTAGATLIDARVETRLAGVIASLLGEDRVQQRADAGADDGASAAEPAP
jgi:flagellar assembly protein FliH